MHTIVTQLILILITWVAAWYAGIRLVKTEGHGYKIVYLQPFKPSSFCSSINAINDLS